MPKDVAFVQLKELRADADVMIPPCCNPCYCLYWCEGSWGGTRHHSFDSTDLGDMLFSLEDGAHHDLARHMRPRSSATLGNKNFKHIAEELRNSQC